MAVPWLDIRSVVTAFVLVLAFFVVNGSGDDRGGNLDSKSSLMIVITDGVEPVSGMCPGEGQVENGDLGVYVQEFQELLRVTTMLLNGVIKNNVNVSPSLKLLEFTCEDNADVIIERIIHLTTTWQVTGVVTVTRGHVAGRLVQVLQYWDVPIVEIVSGDAIARESARHNHFILPHYAYWQIQHAIQITHILNWTALTVFNGGHSSRTWRAIADLFTQQAVDNGTCVLPGHVRGHVPAVVFLPDGQLNQEPFGTDDRTVLLVGNPSRIPEQFVNASDQFVLYLHSLYIHQQQLMEAISFACNGSVNNSFDIDIQQNYGSLCMNFSNLNVTTFGVKYFLDSFVTSVSFVLNMSKFMDSLPCDSSNISLECYLSSRQVMLDTKSNMVQFSRDLFQISYSSNTNSQHHGLFNDFLHDVAYTEGSLKYIPSEVFHKDCGSLCYKCWTCFPSVLAETKLTTSGEGDAVVIGFFPIHQTSKKGFCSEPNPTGYVASVAFLETIKSHTATHNLSHIQGVVFDTCGSLNEVTSLLHSLETCKFYFREEVNGVNISRTFDKSAIIGYVNAMNSFDLPHYNDRKFSLSLHQYGYSTDVDLWQKYTNDILLALIKIRWTVVNVIVSDQEPFRTLSKLINASPLSSMFCFMNQVIIGGAEATLGDSDINDILRGLKQTPGYILLTNLQDTDLVFEKVREHLENTTTKVSLVLTPWSLDAVSNTTLPYVDVIITFTPVVNNVSVTAVESLDHRLKFTRSTWSREFGNVSVSMFLSQLQLSLVLQGIEELLDALEKNYNNGTDLGDVQIKPTHLKVMALYVHRNDQAEIVDLGSVLSDEIPFEGPFFNVCRASCPACQTCTTKDSDKTASLLLEGDLLVTGVFPLHHGGPTAFSCGDPQSNVHKLLQVQSFMFAIETFTTRYPGFFPGLKIGGLVLDSCSNSARALKVVGDFETCSLSFQSSGKQSSFDDAKWENTKDSGRQIVSPFTNVAYVLNIDDNITSNDDMLLETAQLQNAVFMNTRKSLPETSDSFQFIHAIIQILTNLAWDKIIVITGERSEFQHEIDAILSEIYKHNICVVATFHIEPSYLPADSKIQLYTGMPVVLFSSRQTSTSLFDSLQQLASSFYWIIPTFHESWNGILNTVDYFPPGSLIINRNLKQNEHYRIFLNSLTRNSVEGLSTWMRDLWRLRFSCYFPGDIKYSKTTPECPVTSPDSDLTIASSEMYETILNVDAILHSLHGQYKAKCPSGSGLCDQFADDVSNKRLTLGPNVTFEYQGEQLVYTFGGPVVKTLSILNYQRNGFKQVGFYFNPTLTLNVSQIRFYTANGSEFDTVPRAVCEACKCLTACPINDTDLEESRLYMHSATGEFINDLWIIIVLAIAGCGAFLSLVFAVYVVYKVNRKALGKRFVSLGLTLLLSVTLLYLTVLPFMFTPSVAVCGLRYFLTGFSYSLCFSVILVKLMSLQSYKLVGLGGEVSRVNQFLTIFFTVSVQIAIGVHWWIRDDSTRYSATSGSQVHTYICDFNRREFVAYHAYVLFLIFICCVYATCIRNEKKNMGEAKLLMICSLTCLAIWAAWVPCLVLLDQKWSDVIVCAGMLACATAILLIVFIPKIRMVSRLRYDLSQKTANVRNGHSLDTDFLYERPYSLPGTLTSTFSSAKINYPKTALNLDADVNY